MAAITTDELRRRLREKFSSPEYAVLEEVPDGTGRHKSRSADAMAMSLWPSRGLHLHGFEIKVSRGDWLREKKHPEKAEGLVGRCHFWSLVASSREIVLPEELPPGWGLFLPHGGSLRAAVTPTLREATLDHVFLAALLRRAAEAANRKDPATAAEIEAARAAGRAEVESTLDSRIRMATREYEQLRESVAAFEAASGIRIKAWEGGRIGEAVRMLLDAGATHLESRLRSEANDLERQSRYLAELVGSLRKTAQVLEQAKASPAEQPPAEGQAA